MFGKFSEIAGMMKQAKEMQKNMEKMQEELAVTEVKATSCCGSIEAIATCDLELKNIKICEDCIENMSKEILEEKILEAVNNSLNEAKTLASSKMSEISGDLAGLMGS